MGRCGPSTGPVIGWPVYCICDQRKFFAMAPFKPLLFLQMTLSPPHPTERSSLLPIPENEQQKLERVDADSVPLLFPMSEVQQQELVAPLEPLQLLVGDPLSLVASDVVNGSAIDDGDSAARAQVVASQPDHSRPHHRGHRHRWPQARQSVSFESSLLDEIFGDHDDEEDESVALDALFEFATAGELPLEPDELVAATVLIVEEELDYGDLKWSLLSNTFFIFGGFLEVLSSVWDWHLNGENDSTKFWSGLHIAVGIIGPFVYFLNSIVDISWALKVERREERHHQLEELDIDLVAPDMEVQLVEMKRGKKGRRKVMLRLPFEPHNIMRRLRKHIGNRRALGAAIAFGIGGFCEFASAFLGQFATNISDKVGFLIDSMSVDAYLASAMIALCGQEETRKTKSWRYAWTDAARLEGLGDMLFGVTSVVDTLICYLHLGDDVLWWAIISASLWQVDAFCYLRADIISLTLYKANRPLGHCTIGVNSSHSASGNTPKVSTSEASDSLACSSHSDATRRVDNRSTKGRNERSRRLQMSRDELSL